MRFSTTQDPIYLKECLAFHQKRLQEVCPKNLEKLAYHRKQAKWFEAKLRSPFRSSPTPIPERSCMPFAKPVEPIKPVESVKPAGLLTHLWNKIRGI